MDIEGRSQIRNDVQSSRRGPGQPHSLHFSHDCQGKLSKDIPHGSIEITVEPTDPDGMLSEWFDDSWWMDVVQRWVDDAVIIHIAPTPIAVLHPVVLHHIEMLRRVCTRWRIVGYAYNNDICTNDDIEAFVASHFHEVRFIDETRFGMAISNRMEPLPLEKLFASIRNLQASKGAKLPVLVRLPAGTGPKISAPGLQSKQDQNPSQTRSS